MEVEKRSFQNVFYFMFLSVGCAHCQAADVHGVLGGLHGCCTLLELLLNRYCDMMAHSVTRYFSMTAISCMPKILGSELCFVGFHFMEYINGMALVFFSSVKKL